MVDSHETPNVYPNLRAPLNVPLNDQEHFRLNKMNKIKDYFVSEIKERELMSKRLSTYIAPSDYFDKTLIVLSVKTSSISFVSLATVIGAPKGITRASFSLAFSICTRIVKKLLKTTRSKKKKHNKIIILARSKLNLKH